ADLPDWIANFSQTDEPDTDTSDETDLPDWAANFGQTDEPDATPSDEADLPDWAANLGQTDEPDATPSDEADLPDWAANLGQTDEPDATPSDEADLPDWLSGLTQTEEPLAAAASFVQGDSEAGLPDWLHTLEQFHETSDISPAPLDDPTLEDSTLPSLPLELTADPLTSSAAAMETTIMADPTMQDPNRPPNDDPDNELDWLDELINLPTDEPLTVPEDTSDEIDAIADDWPADNDPSEDPRLTTDDWLADDALPDDADHAWLDALSPTDEIAGQDLDWLDSFDQAEVEESPTLSWLSEDDLHGQASNVYPTEETGSGEDLAEAMAWLESLVPEQKTPAPTVEMDDSLTWLDQLAPNEADAAPSIESGYHSDPQDESPTIVESISTLDDPLLDHLFQLDDDTSAADMADSISWLDELAAAPTTPSSPTNNLFHAGPPPDDPEAAMAWLEQLAAAQAAEDNALFDQATTDDDLEPASGWLEQVGDDADLPDIEASWVPTPTADQPAEANWLDLLSETEANLPADQPLPNWLDELTDESGDVIIPGESLFADPSGEQSAEVPLDWLDELAAADDAVLPEQTDGESVPNWFDELPDFTTDEPAPTEEPPQLSNEQAETTTLDPLQPTYVPPTNISPEAAKILDMSDLFEMGEVEESEEDMAQAMAWMNELIGDLGTPTPPPTDEPGEPEPAAETSLTWLDELATTPTDELETETVITYTPDPEPVAQPVYVPPTDISPEAAKILDMSDLFEMGDVEESEEDMAQAMAWMNELIGDLGTPAAAASLAAIAPEPTVSEIEAAAEPVDWLDDLTDEIPSLPEAVLEEPPTPPTSPITAAAEDEAMAWLDEIVADISDEPVAAASSPTETDEALDWLNEIVADMEGETPASEPDTPATSLVEEAASTPEPTPSPASPVYTPPTDISAEAAKILDMSDLFEMDDVEESEEDMAQAMAWMNELIGDMALTPPAAETPIPPIEDNLPVTIISATPVVEDDSALNWLDSLATQDQPIAVLPDLDKPFSVDDLNPEPVTPQDEQAALAWLEQMADEQAEDLTAVSDTITPSEDDLLAELADFPEDPDKAMDWLDQMAAQQSDGAPASVSTAPVVSEPPTPAVPVAVMDALVEVETKREKAKTGPLKPPPTPPTPEPTDEDELPFSLITELAARDVTESLPDWLSLDAIESEEMSLSWLSGRDLDATGWLEAEAEMAEAEPVVDLPFITPTEPIRDEPPPRRAPEPVFVPPTDSSFTFQANLDVGMDDKQFAAARQLLQQRQYQEAMQTYSSLLESSPAVSPIITELEGAVDSHPSQPLLRRLLGDAYMRNGQLQKALETYRKALDQL
ncbi:MAG: tetratricopeptide repeat protein, partial [Anaerolineae bacterium]|nr:tetratricopeptide repeat protein [Anaerolineae bacterium]